MWTLSLTTTPANSTVSLHKFSNFNRNTIICFDLVNGFCECLYWFVDLSACAIVFSVSSVHDAQLLLFDQFMFYIFFPPFSVRSFLLYRIRMCCCGEWCVANWCRFAKKCNIDRILMVKRWKGTKIGSEITGFRGSK